MSKRQSHEKFDSGVSHIQSRFEMRYNKIPAFLIQDPHTLKQTFDFVKTVVIGMN